MLALCQVFGGCCANVALLDAMVARGAHTTVVTFAQFVFVSVAAYPANISPHHSYTTAWLAPPRVPLREWLVQVLLLFAISLASNWCFAYGISMPVFIVLRLLAAAVTMVVGWCLGRRYPRRQVAACAVILAGVLVCTFPGGGAAATGAALVLGATVLLALQGFHSERLNRRYAARWQESLFYTHVLALPLFAAVWPQISAEWRQLNASLCAALALNVALQFVCISGVNKLTTTSPALSVVVVLLVRKVASLLISLWWFNHRLTARGLVGAAMVFGGAALYSTKTKTE
jgi:UDP-xylose/UDP-N-acetylglucosamine transporter B4